MSVEPFSVLELKNIEYTYPNTLTKALDKINFTIEKGESIGVIGKSGSGKSTLMDLILGLLEPQKGEIYFNKSQINNLADEWRIQVAYLPQEIFLIDSTIRNNITFSEDKKSINDNLVIESLKKARLSEFVEQLPKGLDTILGEKGVRLSGGQKQRIALARAFYHKRSILILDESTSALDNETEQEIVKEIHRLKGIKTIIVIAHRLSTVANCDRIYRLNEGSVVEVGTPQEIMRKNNIENILR